MNQYNLFVAFSYDATVIVNNGNVGGQKMLVDKSGIDNCVIQLDHEINSAEDIYGLTTYLNENIPKKNPKYVTMQCTVIDFKKLTNGHNIKDLEWREVGNSCLESYGIDGYKYTIEGGSLSIDPPVGDATGYISSDVDECKKKAQEHYEEQVLSHFKQPEKKEGENHEQ